MKTCVLAITALVLALLALADPLTTQPIVAQAPVAQVPTGWQYISPRPGATLVTPRTTIALRPGDLLDPVTVNAARFKVVGTKSGAHTGSVVLADDGETVIFKPRVPFTLGEIVTVALTPGLKTASGRLAGPVSFSFTISSHEVAPPSESDRLLSEGVGGPTPIAPDKSSPPLLGSRLPVNFPALTVTTPANGTGDGYTFLSPYRMGPGSSQFLLIVDNSGQPVYYRPLDVPGYDFKKQPNGLLTYSKYFQFYVMDSSYNIVESFGAGNGYFPDVHELRLLPNGHALFLIYDSQTMDMSLIVPGGQPNATVTGLVIQELDSARDVVFQWRSWDHMAITDTYQSLTAASIDYVHGNAIEQDTDGNLLISSRHIAEITKINRQTGDIIWRLGGKNNQFTFVNETNDPPFYYRNNQTPVYSRGLEYQLDEVAKTATHVWDYPNTPDTFSGAMGNVQTLPNGNRMIGWGSAGLTTEVKPDGSKAFELAFTSPVVSYRSFRFPWQGHPTTPPLLTAQMQGLTVTLTMSWNGATDIASYRVYGGNGPNPTTLLTTPSRTGFETQVAVANDLTRCLFFRVLPINNMGQPTQYSNEVRNSTACYVYNFPLMNR